MKKKKDKLIDVHFNMQGKSLGIALITLGFALGWLACLFVS